MAIDPPDLNALADTRTLPGRKVVYGMFAFAVTMIGVLFLYWELYTRPFRPLQAAIAAEFPDSSPRAIGGKPKSHLPNSPAILRLIVRIDWDPREDERRAREMANRLAVIAGETLTLSDYERLEVFLMHRRPEQATITWSLDAPLKALPLPLDGAAPEGAKLKVTEGVEGS
jgi:hypothetical protein